MRILILAADFFSVGGIQRYTRYQYKALADLYGYNNIFVFSLTAPKEKNKFDEKFDVYYTGKGINLKSKLNYFIHIVRFIRKNDINLIIVTHVQLSIIAYIIKKMYRIKYFTNVYGLEIWGGLKRKDIIGLLNSNTIIADCKFILEYIKCNFNYNSNKIELLYDPVDMEKFKPKNRNSKLLQKYNIPNDKFIVSTIGRLERNKGHEIIIKSLKELKEDIVYVVVGDGFMKKKLMTLCEDLGIIENVIFTSRVPDHELVDFYNLADVIILLSVFEDEEGEGLPLGLIEASACCKPIIAGNEDGSSEAISDDYPNGFRINPRNKKELVQKIKYLIDNPKLVKKYGENGRKYTLEMFSYDIFKRKLSKMILDMKNN